MEAKTIEDNKLKPREKIAKGLKLVIEGHLEYAQHFGRDLTKIREPMLQSAMRGALGEAEKYLRIAKEYMPNENIVDLITRYESLKNQFRELTE